MLLKACLLLPALPNLELGLLARYHGDKREAFPGVFCIFLLHACARGTLRLVKSRGPR
jgi:hypothetical protein